MLANITTLISGIIDNIELLITPTSAGGETAASWALLLALPVLAGVAYFTRRLVKRAR